MSRPHSSIRSSVGFQTLRKQQEAAFWELLPPFMTALCDEDDERLWQIVQAAYRLGQQHSIELGERKEQHVSRN